MGHLWAPCSCQGRGESLIDPVSESLINHPKSAPRDEAGKTGDKGYLYDYVCINHNRTKKDACSIVSSIWLEFSHRILKWWGGKLHQTSEGVCAGTVWSGAAPARWSHPYSPGDIGGRGGLLWLPVIELNKWLRFQWRLPRPSALCLARATADLINF